jgi:hypothetical protein
MSLIKNQKLEIRSREQLDIPLAGQEQFVRKRGDRHLVAKEVLHHAFREKDGVQHGFLRSSRVYPGFEVPQRGQFSVQHTQKSFSAM